MNKPLFFTLKLDFPVVLAPMAGVTDTVFRSICREHGADITYTEMVSAKGLHYNSKNTGALLETAENEIPSAVQLFGRESEMIAEAVRSLSAQYGEKLAVIDLNMGCPARKIVSNGEGSALMRDLPTAASVIRAAVRASEEAAGSEGAIPISVKFRKGWDEESVNAIDFAKMCEDAGAALIAVHGRTKMQMYTGEADYEIIARVKQAVKIPVFGNGDVFSGENALRLRRETGCDGIMVARGALGNPFIFEEVKAALKGEQYEKPTDAARIDAACEHIRRLRESKGERAVVELRKHVSWYISSMKGASKIRQAVNSAVTAAGMLNILEIYRKGLVP